MCIPDVGAFQQIQGVINLASAANKINTEKQENKYRTQIAINNAKNAQNEALRQKQMGIDASRQEKIQGIQEVSKKRVQSASGGFSSLDGTNQFIYQDVLSGANFEAQKVKNSFDLKADSYFDKANEYLNQASKNTKDYNTLVFQKGMQYLGNANKVAQNWYQNRSNEVSYDNF